MGIENSTPITPYATKTIIWVGIVVAVVSLSFSAAVLWYQTSENLDHIVGDVVSVEADKIVIMSGRGNLTTLIITPETKLADISPVEDLREGTRLGAVGTFVDKEHFTADRIHKFDKKRK